MPGFPVLHYLLEFTKIHVNESVMLSNHLILCCPLLLLPSMFPSIRVFSDESALRIRGQRTGASASAWVQVYGPVLSIHCIQGLGVGPDAFSDVVVVRSISRV